MVSGDRDRFTCQFITTNLLIRNQNHAKASSLQVLVVCNLKDKKKATVAASHMSAYLSFSAATLGHVCNCNATKVEIYFLKL